MREYLDNIMAKDKEIAELKAEVSDSAARVAPQRMSTICSQFRW